MKLEWKIKDGDWQRFCHAQSIIFHPRFCEKTEAKL